MLKGRGNGRLVLAIVVGFAIVAFWRGIWGLLDIYLLPDNHELSFWVSMFLGLAILTVTHLTTRELMH